MRTAFIVLSYAGAVGLGMLWALWLEGIRPAVAPIPFESKATAVNGAATGAAKEGEGPQ